MDKISSTYILELPIQVEKWQEDIISTRLDVMRKIYNHILGVYVKRFHELEKNKQYREAVSKLGSLEEKKVILEKMKIINKEFGKKAAKDNVEYQSLYQELTNIKCDLSPTDKSHYQTIKNTLLKECGITEYGIFGLANEGLGWKSAEFSKTQGISPTNIRMMCYKNIWTAIQALVFKHKKVTFKRINELNSFYGCNVNGVLCNILFDGQQVKWTKSGHRNEKGSYNDMIFPLANTLNEYETFALSNKILYIGIIRKTIRGEFKFYAQFTLQGKSPSKINNEDGKFKTIGEGKVGLDIGTSTLAIVSDKIVKLAELGENAQPKDNKIRLLQRKIDRSIRVSNPNKFNDDGTIIKGNKDKWVFSNNCIKLKKQLREIQRKLAAVRKHDHENLANYILSLGDEVFVESMRFKALQVRAKKTELNEKGKCKKKKRFGKTLGNRAPATLLTILDNKLKSYGKELIKINTIKCKASQYNQFTNEFVKKPLSKRWNLFDNGDKIQRDLYSAFLIQNTNKDLSSFNDEELNAKYNEFKILHDNEIERIKRIPKKKLSSMGIG